MCSMIESLLGDIDPSFTSAKTSKTTSTTPSKPLTTTNKGIVSEEEGGETFSDWLSSLEASGVVTRGGGGGGPVRESFDRIDSERVLDDLMKELDSTSSTAISSNNSYKTTDNNDRRSKRVQVPSIEAWGSSPSSTTSSDISEVYSNTYDNLASQLSGTKISIDDLLGPTSSVPAIDPGTGALPTSISLNAGKKVWTPKSSSSTTTNTATINGNTADNRKTYTKPTPSSTSSAAAPLTSAAGSGAAPDMEQYPDFEAYIAAVLEYEQNKGASGSSPSITTEKGQDYDFLEDDIIVVKKETVADDQYDKSNYIYSKNDDASNKYNKNNKYTKPVSFTSPPPVAAAADDYFIDESYSTTTANPPTNSASAPADGASGGGGSDDEFFADFLDEFYASSSPSSDDSNSDNVKTKDTPITNTEPVATSRPIKAPMKTSPTTSSEATEPTTPIPDTVTTSTLESTSLPATKVTTTTSSSSSSTTNTDNNNNNEYTTMTVVALKQILKDKGLKISGTKTELINRLIES